MNKKIKENLMLKKLAQIRNFINLKNLCDDSKLNYNSIRKRIERQTPELSPGEQKKISLYLKKLKLKLIF